jgi:cysteine desulfurase
MIYLDNNATTPLTLAVRERIEEGWRTAFANPGSQHAFGRAARLVLDDSRETIAGILDADPSELIFTSGGTEAINMAVAGFTAGRPGLIAMTDGEHPATVQSSRRSEMRGYGRVSISVDSSGRIQDSELAKLPWSEIRLVCVILAHNETGVVQNVKLLSDLCQKNGIPLLLDAVQAVGKIPVSFNALNATALAFGAHKFHGPRGVGGLLLRRGSRIAPLLEGGHQESGRRAGTEPVPLIAGMAKALQDWHAEFADRTRQIRELRDLLQNSLIASCSPVVVHGVEAERLPNTLSVAFPGLSGEALLVNLHLKGVACSLGSTCASGSAEPAPALLAMGVDPEICLSSVRFSLSSLNTRQEIEDAAERIASVVRRMRHS